jgi:hypothetical protein
MTPRELAALAAAAPEVTVAVLGDFMLDETWIGTVSRIAPEAPIPLLALSSMSRRAGGAGNVIENLSGPGSFLSARSGRKKKVPGSRTGCFPFRVPLGTWRSILSEPRR